MLLAWQKKRKGPGEADDESDDYPVWVLSPRLFDLYLAGKKPPAEVQLSSKAAKEVKRLKAWARAQDPHSPSCPSPRSAAAAATAADATTNSRHRAARTRWAVRARGAGAGGSH